MGKTTTMVNLAATLVLQGERVLCIDFAQQANLIMSLDCQNPDELPYTVEDVIAKAIREETIDSQKGVIHNSKNIELLPPPYSFRVVRLYSSDTADRIC